jgi:threonine dehydratase
MTRRATRREPGPEPWRAFDEIPIEEAARRLEGVVRRTPLVPFDAGDPRVELRLKLENRQEVGAFKARGAWNQVAQLDEAGRRAGVVATSSGNHGKALAWAAQRAGVRATIVMPADASPNKIAACRELGAEVRLCPTREAAEAECARRVAAGAVLVHPYDAERTIAGAGTLGLELAEEWPELDLVLVQIGGGGLAAGLSLALRRRLGARPGILGVEPKGADSMRRSLEKGRAVTLERIVTRVQGLCPPGAGKLTWAVCATTLDGVLTLSDEEIFAAQRRLVAAGEVVEPAGAAAVAAVLAGRLPLEAWGAVNERPLRVAAIVSGGNPDPAQLEGLRREIAAAAGGAG